MKKREGKQGENWQQYYEIVEKSNASKSLKISSFREESYTIFSKKKKNSMIQIEEEKKT